MFSYVDKYIVKPGDTLNIIAKSLGLFTVKQLLIINPQIQNPDFIYPGQIINIPQIIPMTTYVVKPGDILYTIIERYNVQLQKYYGTKITVNEVLAYNAIISHPNMIYPGMILYLPEIL